MTAEATPSWFVAIDWTGAGEHRFARAGSYELRAPLGRGGLAEVWRAFDRARGVEVAVKFLVHELARDEEFHAALRREVRAVARLDHPAIVQVYALGTLEADAEAATGGRIVAGSPFLAIELARGGTLASLPIGTLRADDLRSLAFALLGALGHAHARGVVHRDVKPNNVLLRRSGDLRAGVVLTDFGMARLDAEDDGGSIGTVRYMAPEQALGTAGANADLYSLAAMLWELATGTLPYPPELDPRARALVPIGEFEPLSDVPAAFGEWLRSLLADRYRRPERAADAARALEACWPGVPIAPARAPRRSMLSLGLGTYGLAALPLVGRAAEWTALDRAFADVRAGGARALQVHGPSGIGATRLCASFCAELDERAEACVLRADGDDEGLRRALLREVGDRRIEARLRARGIEDVELAEALEAAVRPECSARERAAAALAYASHRQPAIVWLDAFDDASLAAIREA